MAGTDETASEASTTPSAPSVPSAPSEPMLRIVSPNATPEEVAAIVAVFASLGGAEPPARKRRPEWNTPHRMVRPAVSHGPGGWRASALPR